MSIDLQAAAKLETGQILAVQIVTTPSNASELLSDGIDTLILAVEQTDAFRGAKITGKVRRLPIQDGLALIFTSTPDMPVRCAIQISKALRKTPIRVRMGIHRGPIPNLKDAEEIPETPGPGVERALRVMECGDAGHILLTRELAGGLGIYRHNWQPHLEHLGEFQLDNGELISVVNLYTGEAGRQEVPTKLASLPVSEIAAEDRAVPMARRAAVLLGIILAICLSAFVVSRLLTRLPTPAEVNIHSEIPEKSIAVLPFENITGNAETAICTDGVQDEILTDLAKLADLKVISRTSVLQYKKGERNLREIGRQLGVAYILEGSVQREGDRIRVTAQLIDARTDAHIWAQTYDRVVADVFAIQTDIAKTITEQLKVQLSPQERAALAETATTDLVADRLFRQAFQHLVAGSNPDAKASLLASVPLLEEAVQRDPKFIRAYSLLATAHLDLYWQGFDHTPARTEEARRVLEQMIATDANSGETHFIQGLYAYRIFRDYDRARAELEQARLALPNNASIYVILGAMDRRQGRWNEAVRNLNRSIELDPRNFRFILEGGFTYQAMRRYMEASSLYSRALNIQPRDSFARTQLTGIPFLERGDVVPLHNEIATILKEDPTAATAIAGAIFYSALAEHNAEEVTRALQAIRPEGLRDDYNNSLWPRDWFVGLAARAFGNEPAARAAFEAAREIEARNVYQQPEYAPAWSRLGLIEAALGQKEAALNASRRACELIPVTVDSFDGVSYRINLVLAYLWTGERDAALRELEEVAKLPGSVTYGELLHYPHWDALRGDPRFEKIVASLAPHRD